MLNILFLFEIIFQTFFFSFCNTQPDRCIPRMKHIGEKGRKMYLKPDSDMGIISLKLTLTRESNIEY